LATVEVRKSERSDSQFGKLK